MAGSANRSPSWLSLPDAASRSRAKNAKVAHTGKSLSHYAKLRQNRLLIERASITILGEATLKGKSCKEVAEVLGHLRESELHGLIDLAK